MAAKETEWFRTWFDSAYYHLLYNHRDEKEAAAFLDHLLAVLDLPVGARLLDLACGRGRHSIHMALKGYRVTGLDLSPESIQAASATSLPGLEFYIHDMRYPFRVNYYDCVMSLFSSFGYFRHERENHNALKWAIAALKPGGYFVLDFMNTTWVKQNLITSETTTRDDIGFHITRRAEPEEIVKSITVRDGGQEHQFEERVRAYSHEKLEIMLQELGTTIIHRFGNYELEPFVWDQAERIIFIARKQAN